MRADPALGEELRAQILTKELLGLPQLVAELAEGRKETAKTVAETSKNLAEISANLAEISALQKQTDNTVAELVAAQKQTDKTLAELSAAQKHTDESIAELSAAQKHTDESLAELSAAQKHTDESIAELSAAQKHTDETVAELSEIQKQTNQALGRLSDVVGGTVEEDAKCLLEYVASQNGWDIQKPPSPMDINGEIDVIAIVRDKQGKEFALVCEAKTRLRPQHVRRAKATMSKLELPYEHIDYVYGLSLYPGSKEAAIETGLGLLSIRGELVAPRKT